MEENLGFEGFNKDLKSNLVSLQKFDTHKR